MKNDKEKFKTKQKFLVFSCRFYFFPFNFYFEDYGY